MKSMFIGEVIRKHRIEKGISQSTLCEGLCNQASLSRIETGEEYPKPYLWRALMERLGIYIQYYASVTQEDYEMQEWKEKIMNGVLLGEAENVMKLIREAKQKSEIQGNLLRQFYLRYQADVKLHTESEEEDYSKRAALNILFDAIRITIPDFQPDSIGQYLLCFEESKIIVDIAMAYDSIGKQVQALNIYRQLFEYVENHYGDIEDFIPVIPMLAYQYSKLMLREGQYDEASRIAEYGRHYSVRLGRSACLSNLLEVLGICDLRLKRQEGSEKLKQAYYLMQALRHPEEAAKLYNWAKENYNIDLTEDEMETDFNQ